MDEKSADEMGMLNQIETNLPKGLWPAIEEFLYHNKNWVIWEKKANNNGLTVLKRIYFVFEHFCLYYLTKHAKK